MQVLCPYYVKDHMKAMLYWQQCGFIFQIELSELILKQLILKSIYFIHFDCYFALNQNMVVH